MKLAVLPTDRSFEFMLGYHSLGLILFLFDPFPVRVTQTILQTAQISPSQHQGCTNRCSLAAGLRGNEERMRK